MMMSKATTTSLGLSSRPSAGHFAPLLLLFGLLQQVQRAQAHGTTLSPRSRAIGLSNHCPWCDGGHYAATNPSGTVNHDAVPSSPCFGSERDMAPYPSTMFGGHSNLATNPFTQYAAGQTFEAKVLLNADHGGDAAWMLCPYAEAETEECFRNNVIEDFEDVHTFWGGDSTIDHWKDNQYFPQNITFPADLEPGEYTLRWIWVCKFTDEIFVSCIDMYIGAAGTEVVNPDPLGSGAVDSGAGSGGGSGGACAGQYQPCLASPHTCCNAGDTCFEKDGYYAQCRPDCTGTEDTLGFSCRVLGGDGPTTAPTSPTMAPTSPTLAPTAPSMAPTLPTTSPTPSTSCTDPTENMGNCSATKCCNAGWTCYERDAYYARCLPCPRQGENGWTCNVLVPPVPTVAPTMAPTAPTMAPTTPITCTNPTENSGNCSATKCCNSGWTCYERDAYYAECRRPCPPDDEVGWTCNVLSPLLQTSFTSVLLQGATNSTATCAENGQSCASTPCCDGTCFEKDGSSAECKDECTDADRTAGWSCVVLAHPAAHLEASCSPLYEQCGGKFWSGPRSCCEGKCTEVDSIYHQCKPTSLRQIHRHGSFLAARASALMQQEKAMTHGICSAAEVHEVQEGSEELEEFNEEL